MMKSSISFFRHIYAVLTLVMLVFFSLTSCSSDDDGDAVSLPGTVPNLLNYEISQVSGVLMALAVNPQVTVSSMSLNGTLDRNSETITLNAPTPPAPAMDVSTVGFLQDLEVSFVDYKLYVISAATWTGDSDPTSGEFDIVSANEQDRINVKVNDTLTGVDITYLLNEIEEDSASLTWQQFDDAFDNPQLGKEFAAVASFATSLLRSVYELGDLVVETLEFIDENSDLMEEIGTVEEACDIFPGNRPPDIMVANPGSIAVGWNDEDNDTSISSGDKVFLEFFECWDDETDTIDRLYNRGITFNNYTEVQSGNVITRVGFESPDGIVAGLVFDSLEITETEDNGVDSTVISIDQTITVSGGFSMVFTAP